MRQIAFKLVGGVLAMLSLALRAAEPPAAVDLRPEFEHFALPPRDQGGRPTCSVFTFAGALEFAGAKQQQRGERLSVEFLNWAANQARNGVRDGGFFSELWTGFAQHGICLESALPYQTNFSAVLQPDATAQAQAAARRALNLQVRWVKAWNVKTGLSAAEFGAIKTTLALGWPVCGGFRWPKNPVWHQDVLQPCVAADVFDGHSVLLVGYRDDNAQPGGGFFILRNSNRSTQDNFMPYAYAREFMNDAVWVESGRQRP